MRSRKKFEISCRSLAYPGGDVDDAVQAGAAKAGYRMAFTTRSGVNNADTPPLLLNRTEVSASDPFLVFCLKMMGVYDWLGFRDTVAYRNALRRLNMMFARAGQANRDAAA